MLVTKEIKLVKELKVYYPRVLMWVSVCELVSLLSAGTGRVIAFANFRAESPLGIDNLPIQYIFVLSG